MQTLQIDKANARKLYPTSSLEFKQMLEDTFGKTFFQQRITDRIKTFQDACDAVGPLEENVLILLKYNGINKDMLCSQAHMKLTIIARVLNEGWTPDWNDKDQYKYYPYFDMRSNGFSSVAYDRWSTNTVVSSRLCFKSRDIAQYAATQFADIYKTFLTL
jgi:hypothetical protein